MAPVPNFAWKDNPAGSDDMGNAMIAVEVDAVRQVGLISQLAAIESALGIRIEKVDIVGFVNLRLAVCGHAFADADLFCF